MPGVNKPLSAGHPSWSSFQLIENKGSFGTGVLLQTVTSTTKGGVEKRVLAELARHVFIRVDVLFCEGT